MKSHLKLTAENIGNSVYIKTTDNFICEGVIKSFTDTNVEVRDSHLRNTFTIFYFEIKEIEINNECSQNDKTPKIEQQVSAEIQPDYYEHPIFGRLLKTNKHIEYFNIKDFSLINTKNSQKEANVYKCKYIVINSSNDLYTSAVKRMKESEVFGISFYHNEYGSEIIKYLTISCFNFNLIINVNGLSCDEFKTKYSEIVSFLTDESSMKLVYGGNQICSALKRVFQLELENFMDIQILYYGLHNLRVAEQFKTGLKYSKMVDLLFKTTFKLKNEPNFSKDDITNKMAFNSHFLIPMYKLMISRLVEPVKLLSKRICLLTSNNEDGNEELNDLDLKNSSEINYDILPRSLLFWTYKDNLSVLQAKKLVDNEMQNERQALNANSNLNKKGCDIVEINKTLAKTQELKSSEMNYYEVISESDDEDNTKDQEIGPLRTPNKMWNNRKLDVFQPDNENRVEVKAEEKQPEIKPVENYRPLGSVALGLGRGRGSHKKSYNNSFQSIDCDPLPVENRHDKNVKQSSKIDIVKSDLVENFSINGNDRGSLCDKHDFLDNQHHHNHLSQPDFSSSPLSISDKLQDIRMLGVESSSTNPGSGTVASGSGKGRGMKFSMKKKPSSTSQSSSVDSSRQFVKNCSNTTEPVEDAAPAADYCEMSISRWNRNAPGKLCFDRFSDEQISSINKNNESMGIMWNTLGLRCANETEELYREFGL